MVTIKPAVMRDSVTDILQVLRLLNEAGFIGKYDANFANCKVGDNGPFVLPISVEPAGGTHPQDDGEQWMHGDQDEYDQVAVLGMG